MLSNLLIVRLRSRQALANKPFSNLSEVLWLQVVSITPGHNYVVQTRVAFDMLEDNLPALATRLLGRFRDCLSVGSDCV